MREKINLFESMTVIFLLELGLLGSMVRTFCFERHSVLLQNLNLCFDLNFTFLLEFVMNVTY